MSLVVAASPLLVSLRIGVDSWTWRWRATMFSLLALSAIRQKSKETDFTLVLFSLWCAMLALAFGLFYEEAQVLTIFGFLFIGIAMKGSLDDEVLLNAVSSILVLQCILALWQYTAVNVLGDHRLLWPFAPRNFHSPPATGTLGNSSVLGVYIAVSWPFLLRPGWKWFVPLAVAGALAAGSLTAMLSFLAVAVSRRGALLAASGVIAALWMGFLQSATTRLNVWTSLLERVDSNPLFGAGIGSFANDPLRVYGRWPHPHNEWLQVAFETGALGLVLLFIGIWPYLLNAWRNQGTHSGIWRASLAGGFISSLTMFPFRLAETSFLLLAVLAVASREDVHDS